MEKLLESLGKAILNFPWGETKEEEELIKDALKKLREKLGSHPLSGKWEVQSACQAMLKEFSCFMVAVLTVVHSKQPLVQTSVVSMESALGSKGITTQIFFLEKICGPLCRKGDRDTIEIVADFLCCVNDDKVVGAAQKVLVDVGRAKNDQAKSDVIEALLNHLPNSTNTLYALAEVDPERGTSYAVGLLGLKDEDLRQAALHVLAATPLTVAVVERVVAFLKSPASKAVWKDVDHRVVVYEVIQNCLKAGLSRDGGLELAMKAFQHEGSNLGLSNLLPVITGIDPRDKDKIISGFLAMETRKNHPFQLRKDTVKKFLSGLKGQQRIDYLREGLLKSDDEQFCWFAGQHLIAADAAIAAKTFVDAIKANGTSKGKIATLTQLAVKVCDSGNSGEWEANALNKGSKARFEPITEVILAFTEESDCPIETQLTIAFQPLMYGGSVKLCQRAIPVTERVLLDKACSASLFSDALQALFNNADKKDLKKDVDDVLRNVYSKKKKDFLVAISKIIMNGGDCDYARSLFAPAASFLKNIEASEAVPILRKALNSPVPDGDLGLFTRSDYVNILKNFALKGSVDALDAIASYRKKNILGEVIPKTLVEIYRKSSPAVRGKIAHAVGERFLYSVKKPDSGIFYLDELAAVEALKGDPTVQDMYLRTIETIGAIDHVSAGMCNIVNKALVIMPKARHDAARFSINVLICGLGLGKGAYLAKYPGGRRELFGGRDAYLVTLDALLAEAGMILAGA